MPQWTIGQRVLNQAEPNLGLGQVQRILDQRNLEIYFGASQVTRVYNIQTAPLKRLVLKTGQEAIARDGTRLRVTRITRRGQLLIYYGDGKRLAEVDLADTLPSSDAIDRLLTGQVASHVDFDLRVDGWSLRQTILSKTTRGLVGARVRLLGHQLYIAQTVARRENPRVLLADEVGLGKTIEAGLIFSALRALGRADRVLVLVPESLVHQWLAELYRKFGVMFSVLDEQRCDDLDESPSGPTPFQSSRLAICNYEFLSRDRRRLKQALDMEWDLIIVDEAHHLHWTPTEESPQYVAVRRLSERSAGLLLLTATPQREGLHTEFALLRLVDPDRFSDLDTFVDEQNHMRGVANLAKRLTDPTQDHAAVRRELKSAFAEDEALHRLLEKPDAHHIVDALLDRHGTGRVLMRNRRERLQGFPGRELHPVALEVPARWHDMLLATDPEKLNVEDLLASPAYLRPSSFQTAPPKALRAWKTDPRALWLVDFVRAKGEEKVVLISSRPATVLALQTFLRDHTAITTAVFHEQLSVVERDRQMAYFAEADGAQLLLCSEIGGEGRNLQFAHHLVLFDLPLHPDLLEQRIGRLDRIGQGERVQVYALYLRNTPSEAVFHWHRDGLGSFERHVSGAEGVFNALHQPLQLLLRQFLPSHAQHDLRQQQLETLLDTTRHALEEARRQVGDSVDYLVDLNSYDESVGQKLVAEIQEIDRSPQLAAYMGRIFDRFGIVDEELDRHGRRRIHPSDLMFVDSFPGLPHDDGIGATYRRSLALTREDLEFITRDHALVEGALSLMLDQDAGRASVCSWEQAPESGAVLQFLFLLEATGTPSLELNRYLPITPVVMILDLLGKEREDLRSPLEHATFAKVAPQTFDPLIAILQRRAPRLAEKAQHLATSHLEKLRTVAQSDAAALMREEHERLLELQKINPTLPQREIDGHARKLRDTLAALAEAQARLDAVRLILLSARAPS